MIKKEWVWMYFNDEWNKDPNDENEDDTVYEDGIDERPTPKETHYNDDDYDY